MIFADSAFAILLSSTIGALLISVPSLIETISYYLADNDFFEDNDDKDE